MKRTIIILIISLFVINVRADILTVKTDGTGHFTSIQQAYLAASSGDTLLVYPGTYYENIDINIPSKNITIASLYLTTSNPVYIANTIVNGNQTGSCFAIRNTGQAVITIIGFTITNGSGYGNTRPGGGLYVLSSILKISSCYIRNNIAYNGGGIFSNSGSIFLSSTIIKNNIGYFSAGGLAILNNSNIVFDTLNRCSIYLNYSAAGSDVCKSYLSAPLHLAVDTFTVLYPDRHYTDTGDQMGFPVNDITFDILHGKIQPVKADLYVDPQNGSDDNSGLTTEDALKTISFALLKIIPDSVNTNTIFLANGMYSPSSNGEIFPLGLRSYVNLIGQNRDSTILNAEFLTYLFRGRNGTGNYSIKKISLINGSGNALLPSTTYSCFVLNFNNNLLLDEISVNYNVGRYPHLTLLHTDNAIIRNIQISDNEGSAAKLGYTYYPANPGTFRIENMIIRNNTPHYSQGLITGGGLGINGSLALPDFYQGSITNVQITENIAVGDPIWGPRQSGFLGLYNVKVDVVNATIGNNILREVEGYAVGLVNGVKLNLYNSILYADSLYEMLLGSPHASYATVTANIAYCNIEGGPSQIYNYNNANTLNWLDGNIDADPLWVGSGDNFYQLQSNSPCINAGTPMYSTGMLPPYIKLEDNKIVLYKVGGDTLHLPPLDLAGNPRISGGRIDMGAYEFDPNTNIHNPNRQHNLETGLNIYPNPFTAHTFIAFRLKTAGKVAAIIHDIEGRHVKTLMDALVYPGEYSMIWQGNDDAGNTIPTGIYIISLYHNHHMVSTAKIVKR